MSHPRKSLKPSKKVPHAPMQPTLDGQPASISFPQHGAAIVTTPSGRRLVVARERAKKIMAHDGAFASPAFARPRSDQNG